MILLAGGTGRLGTVLAARLAGNGQPVRVLTRDPARAAHLAAHRVEVATGDVRDRASLTPALRGADAVVSAVHGFTGPRGVSPATIDYQGNVNLIQAAGAAGAQVVLMSVVGAAPDSAMELFRMKHAAEEHLRGSGVGWTVVRATAFMELWIDLLTQTAARSGRPVVFGRGDNPINFVSVTDVAALVERVLTDPPARGRVLEISGPDDITFNQLAAALQAAAGRARPPRHVSPLVLRIMAQTVGRVKPELGRQARAAVVMDGTSFARGAADARRSYPELPCTPLGTCLQSWHDAARGATSSPAPH